SPVIGSDANRNPSIRSSQPVTQRFGISGRQFLWRGRWLLSRQLLLGLTRAASIDQYTCITAKMYAALTPNTSNPPTASRAPIIRQRGCSVSPDAPRVLIESTE